MMLKHFEERGRQPHWETLNCVVFCAFFFWASLALYAEPASPLPSISELQLRDLIQRVVERNESIQVRMLELEINRKKLNAERGMFEPELVGSAEHLENRRENTAEQARSQLASSFEEKNNIYNGGLESLVPTGARVRLGYTLRKLDNSLQTRGPLTNRGPYEYATFFGASIVQPLLKNGGLDVNLATIRLAALSSELAFQDYRRQMMLVISTAEASYWNLYMAQQQLLFFKESVALAETVLKDNRGRLEAGRGSELEVLEAEAGLALRKSKQSDALQKFYESVNRLTTLYSGSVVGTNPIVMAVDEPQATELPFSYYDSWQAAFELNPDYLTQRNKVLAEGVRLAYAKNQRLPQLDLKASYGLNGLGDTPGRSWEDVEQQDFPSWSIGLEMRIPLGGGIKGRNERDAAKLREKQALISLKEVETQIANGLDTAFRKVRSARDSVQSYQEVVNFSQNLLQSELARLDVGRVESRKVLEVEAQLFEAKNSVVEALVQYQRALLELELIQGSTLKARNLELTQRQLEAKTALLVKNGRLSDEQYERFLQALKWEYEKKPPLAN